MASSVVAKRSKLEKVEAYKSVKSASTPNGRGTLGAMKTYVENKTQKRVNNLSYKMNGIALMGARIKRNLQRGFGVSEEQLQDAFPDVYEWERRNPKKTKAISQIETAKTEARKGMNNTDNNIEKRIEYSFTTMILDIIKNMLSGAKSKETIIDHNKKNPENSIKSDTETQQMIQGICSSVLQHIKQNEFNTNDIGNNKYYQKLKEEFNKTNDGKTTKQLEDKLILTEYRFIDTEYKELLNALQERKTELEKLAYIKNTETNSASGITGEPQKKIDEYNTELLEIDDNIANTKDNLKNNQEKINDALKGHITTKDISQGIIKLESVNLGFNDKQLSVGGLDDTKKVNAVITNNSSGPKTDKQRQVTTDDTENNIKITTNRSATTVAEKPETRFQKTQQTINTAKKRVVEKNKQNADSVRKQTEANKKIILEKKIANTGPMGYADLGLTHVPQEKKSQQDYIKNKQNNISLDYKGGAKVFLTKHYDNKSKTGRKQGI